MKRQIQEALTAVIYPGFSKDIVSFGFVKDVELSGDIANISLEIPSVAQEVSNALKEGILNALSPLGLSEINIDIKTPQIAQEAKPAKKNLAPSIKNFVMVSSGKGGVGKSTTTVNLAIAAAANGKKVGILDADIYGPNIARMLGNLDKPEVSGEKLKPLFAHGISFISMANLVDEGQSIIWRGAMIIKTITQLLTDVLWGDLDILFIDMPPGTGDAQLTLAQSVPVSAGIAVTTPQMVAIDDAKRSLDMFTKLHIPLAGIIENMSGFICPESQKEYEIFGKNSGLDLANAYSTTVLAQIPIEVDIRKASDSGVPITISAPSSTSSNRYMMAVNLLEMFLKEVDKNSSADNSQIQPH